MELNGNNKLMVVAADPTLRRTVSGVLSEAGYDVCIDRSENERRSGVQVVEADTHEKLTLKLGIVALFAIALFAAAGFLFFYRHTEKEEVKVHAAINRLQSGIPTEAKMVEVVRKAQEEMEQQATESSGPQGQGPKQLRLAGSPDDGSLKRQIQGTDRRLKRLEAERSTAKDVIRFYSPSICLIQVVFGFKDPSTGLPLRYAKATPDGKPEKDAEGHSAIGINGTGREVQINAFGTGFVVSSNGQILTNHHVVEPWWQDDDLGELLKQGFKPVISEVSAYFPTSSRKVPVHVEKISSEADLAVVAGDLRSLNLKPLDLDDRPGAAVSGEPVVLLGYPTALDAILARAGGDTLRSLADSANDASGLMKELAQRKLIRPVNTQGHIGDVLPDKIVYDAQTASGGSGSPLFNAQGKVIGINFAVLRDFGGSNFAIPVRYARSLLSPQVASAK
ncbi:MAG: hhoA [Candidatus Angelobacter sp.]|jgi:S1-C subfamily serine protease|nr:hhoA [Candidatus Angelobacter sp.]